MTTEQKTQENKPVQQKKRAPRGARRRSRELALKGIYEFLMSGSDAAQIDAAAREEPDFASADADLYSELLNGVLDNFADVEQTYLPYIDRDPKALSPIERSILLMGTYELKNNPQTPYKVVINEAVELAKEFGGTDGFRYVNGVLDKLVPVLRSFEVQKP